VSNAAQINVVSRHRRNAPDRRVLIVAASPAGVSLPVQLAGAGYDARVVDAERASQAIAEFAPHVMLIETGAGEISAGKLDLARRLRAGRATSALPLVLLFEHDDADLRASALAAGADDYFALATPPAEIATRLDALFWRMEAGRRTASLAALEQRAEIDNFLHLLDAVRADIDEDAIGVLALIAARGGAAEEDRTLAAAYDFFKLNLRRLDSIAFYGPTLLLVYLPHRTANAAHAALVRVSDEFAQTQAGVPLKIGLASFPANGTEIENLIEHAELSLSSSVSQDARQQQTIENSLVDLPATESSISNSAPPAPSTARVSTAAASKINAEQLARALESSERVVRESKQPDDMETSVMSAGGGESLRTSAQITPARAAADAAARERERRARGAIMPCRLLLTISDPARMAQINLLLRSSGYEVRAAFDAMQAINLLRIERPDLLVIDDALAGIDGLEALRRLRRQHHDRLPLPVVLLLSEPATRELVRAEAQSLGVSGFVNVPYDAEELLTCVRSIGNTD